MLKNIFGELEDILRKDKERLALCGGCDADDGGSEYDKQKVVEIMFKYAIDTLRKLRERIYNAVEVVRENAFIASLSIQREKTKEQVENENGMIYEYKGKDILLTGKEKEYYEVADTTLDCVLEMLACEIENAIGINEFVLSRIKEGKSLSEISEEIKKTKEQHIVKKGIYFGKMRKNKVNQTFNERSNNCEECGDNNMCCIRTSGREIAEGKEGKRYEFDVAYI